MTNEQAFLRLMEKCDIYFEDSLISKERIIRKYAEFLSSSFNERTYSLAVAQHTGSICFDVVSFLVAALGCLALNETDGGDVVQSFEKGQIVLYTDATGKKKERRLWCGFAKKVSDISISIEESDFDNAEFAVLRQPKQRSADYIPRSGWNRISPYKGSSARTDGVGIKKLKSNRNEFISFLFDVPIASIPSVIGVSTVVVTDRDVFRRIANGLRVEFGEGNSIGLLDLVTASYYTSNLNEQQFGTNPAKTEPALKITSKISAARDLVLDKNGNRTIGFMIIGTDMLSSKDSELTELLERKSLNFSMVTASVDSDVAQEIITSQDEASIFVCTKEFLLQHSEMPKETNRLTVELDTQIENIVNNEVSLISVDGVATWQDIQALKNALFAIKRSDIRSEDKDDFIITAHSLANLALTAVFPLGRVNEAFEKSNFAIKATAPSLKIDEIWKLAERPTEMIDQFIFVAELIDRLYKSVLTVCPKYDALTALLEKHSGKKIAIVVPKGYYVDILKADNAICSRCNTIITANRFNGAEQYDLIIAAGDFTGTHFNPLKCRSASDIFVLLYDGEAKFFMHKKHKADDFEKSLNVRLRVETEEESVETPSNESDIDVVASVVSESLDLENYIDTITSFDINIFAQRLSGDVGNAPSADIYAAGCFISGEKIFFTRYYQAVVFDETNGTVKETHVDSLRSGDILVFAKRDNTTKNMVDYIFEQLLKAGRLSKKVIDATEKAAYWKLALLEYKEIHDISYREVAKRLRGLGLTIQEVSVRQWLIDDSFIVGPREEGTLVQIANLTQDPYLIKDTRGYFEACDTVRKQRKNILKLIGKAIVDKLSGIIQTGDKLLEFIYENVENLSETLELDEVSVLDKQVSIPVTLTNRPIKDMEDAL